MMRSNYQGRAWASHLAACWKVQTIIHVELFRNDHVRRMIVTGHVEVLASPKTVLTHEYHLMVGQQIKVIFLPLSIDMDSHLILLIRTTSTRLESTRQQFRSNIHFPKSGICLVSSFLLWAHYVNVQWQHISSGVCELPCPRDPTGHVSPACLRDTCCQNLRKDGDLEIMSKL